MCIRDSRNGVQAALLARLGFTSVPQPFDGSRSFHSVYSRGLPANMAALDELGKIYELDVRGVVIKPYPCCVSAHTSIDAALRLRNEEGVRPDDIRRIELGVTRYTYDKLSYHRPTTGLEGKFSANYAVARAITDGRLPLSAFSDESVRDPEVRRLVERIEIKVDDAIDRAWKIGSRPVQLKATLADGRSVEKVVEISKGNPEVPVSTTELHAKFRDCASLVLSPETVQDALRSLADLAHLPSIASLNKVLGAQRAPSRSAAEERV